MTNIFKAFMYDLRTDGFVYAVKSTVREFNPYAQLRDARAWMEDQRETIEALAQEVVRLEAQLEATKYVFVTGNDRPEHVTPRSWRYAYCPPPMPTVEEYFSDLVSERRTHHDGTVADWLKFNNGSELSVQASRNHYCEPRTDTGPWTHFEVGFADKGEFPELAPYAEEPTSRYSIHSYVPAKVLGAILARCGGVQDN